MSQAKLGDTVRVHYTGKLTDGSVFETSREQDPLEVKIGSGQVIAGIERAIQGMSPGESKRVKVSPSEAFGQRQKDRILCFKRSDFPADTDPKVGQQTEVHMNDGRTLPAVVTSVEDSTFTVDANHPLAGEELAIDLQLMEII